MAKRRLEASFSAGAALIWLEIRQDSCVKSPCPAKKSASIRHSANFQTGPRKCQGLNEKNLKLLFVHYSQKTIPFPQSPLSGQTPAAPARQTFRRGCSAGIHLPKRKSPSYRRWSLPRLPGRPGAGLWAELPVGSANQTKAAVTISLQGARTS